MGEYIASNSSKYSFLLGRKDLYTHFSSKWFLNLNLKIKDVSYCSLRNIVVSMDPDAPHREKRQLHDLDVVIMETAQTANANVEFAINLHEFPSSLLF